MSLTVRSMSAYMAGQRKRKILGNMDSNYRFINYTGVLTTLNALITFISVFLSYNLIFSEYKCQWDIILYSVIPDEKL